MSYQERLPALDGLRVVATAAIFLFHSGLLPNGTFPVTLFFMLSGFMMYYTKKDTIKPLTAIVKLKRMYPIHLITFISSFFVWKPWLKCTTTFIVKSAVMQLLLVQSWFQGYAMTFNGLAWYLSVTAFLYLISFPLIQIVKKIKQTHIAMFVLLTLIAISNLCMGGQLYLNPLYRVLDCSLGMTISKQFIEHNTLNNSVSYNPASNISECGLFIVFVCQYFFSFIVTDNPGYYSLLFSVALYIFAEGQGMISRVLSATIFHNLASYCFEFYMIHELILRIFRHVVPELEEFSKIGYLIRVTEIASLSFCVSCVLVYVIKRLYALELRK